MDRYICHECESEDESPCILTMNTSLSNPEICPFNIGLEADWRYEPRKKTRPNTCEGRFDGKQCRNRKNLKRIDLISGWGLPKKQQRRYRQYLCPSCQRKILSAKEAENERRQ